MISDETRLRRTDLSLNLVYRLQLIGVLTVGQLRILLAVDQKTRSQMVTMLRRKSATFQMREATGLWRLF